MTDPIKPLTLAFAGLFGMAGVAMAAAASHGGDARLLGSASAMCLAHAPALMALHAGWNGIRFARWVSILLVGGTALFGADLLSRQYLGGGIFPLSAPLGGFLMLAGWLALILGALLPRRSG